MLKYSSWSSAALFRCGLWNNLRVSFAPHTVLRFLNRSQKKQLMPKEFRLVLRRKSSWQKETRTLKKSRISLWRALSKSEESTLCEQNEDDAIVCRRCGWRAMTKVSKRPRLRILRELS
ncbi:MAG: hypothetical protein K2W82_00145 [Candidatus Obscuribacterales bacterium]|nr:hypothetical protein [Candidatus Obscuribacterales bacterium]